MRAQTANAASPAAAHTSCRVKNRNDDPYCANAATFDADRIMIRPRSTRAPTVIPIRTEGWPPVRRSSVAPARRDARTAPL
jgi:hypothetical protein